MGCLNSKGQFEHWFANIHFSGPCNRSCYFCIGQHMMALDSFNNLGEWPLKGMPEFLERCMVRGIEEINLTGTNTDPLLYAHIPELINYLRLNVPGVKIGIRTNAALGIEKSAAWSMFDEVSISVTSLNPQIYKKTMGSGEPPDIKRLLKIKGPSWVRVNVVLCPEILEGGDIFKTLDYLADVGIKTVNIREPYGQPHIGCPIKTEPSGNRLGMPRFDYKGVDVTYWDVHYVEVESVNLYASGRVSETYPITKGCAENGEVKGQENFAKSGRQQAQWLGK